MRPSVRLRELAEEYAALLRSAFGDRLVAIALFGPVARGEAHASSDVDVLVVVDPVAPGPFSRKDLLAAADEAIAPLIVRAREDGLQTRLVRIVRTRAEVEQMIALHLELAEDGVLLLDRGGFLGHLLREVRAALAALGARRVRDGGTLYWEMRRDDGDGDARVDSPGTVVVSPDACGCRGATSAP